MDYKDIHICGDSDSATGKTKPQIAKTNPGATAADTRLAKYSIFRYTQKVLDIVLKKYFQIYSKNILVLFRYISLLVL